MSRVLPILFNTEMVQVILSGRKTCTRRIVKFLPDLNPNWTGYIKDGLMLYNGRNEPCCRKPQYEVGDILYVREAWNQLPFCGDYIYRADDIEKFPEGQIGHIKYKPSIHMPKEAARIWLKVTDVRMEQLQDINEEQIAKEGIDVALALHLGYEDGREKFAELWNSTLNKKQLEIYGWNEDPWVCGIEFERCEEKNGECKDGGN